MPAPRHRCTLVGFSDELDWRELNFVEPIPSSRICQACGLVTRVTGLLPCRHIFCKNCYEQCRSDDGHCCPLDGQQVLADEVEWIQYPVQNLLKRKVKCWNEDRGCDEVLAASELNEHFNKGCDHHTTSCPRCSTVVLCNNVCAHIQSECRDHVVSLESVTPKTVTDDHKEIIMALNEGINVSVSKIEGRIDQVVNENTAQRDRLDELSHCMNTVKETLLEISSRNSTLESLASSSEAMHGTLNDHGEKLLRLAGTISNSSETFKEALQCTKRSVEQFKETTGNTLKSDLTQLINGSSSVLKETFRKELQDAALTMCSKYTESVARIIEVKDCEKRSASVATNMEKILALSTMNVRRHEFLLGGLKAMKENALSKGNYDYQIEEMYICGYHLSPAVYFEKKEQHVLLCPSLQIHKGIIDNVLQWPFDENVRLTIKHPFQSKESQYVGVPNGKAENYRKPDKKSNKGVYFGDSSLSLDVLEREGYVTNDKLRVVWELISKN